MIRFLFGRPDAGKTYHIRESVKAHIATKERAYLHVPGSDSWVR